MDSWLQYYNRQATLEEQLLYAHFGECAQVESPNMLIERFRKLFLEGIGYSSPQVCLALEKIVFSDFAEKEFKFLLNRSCYILINQWLNQPKFQGAIPELIELFETAPASLAPTRTNQRLRELVTSFTQSEQYRALRQLAQVFLHKSEEKDNPETRPLITLMPRYPCLYEHCLLTNDSTGEQRQQVRRMQDRAQRQFEVDLSRYITYQHLPRHSQSGKNPTLLSNEQLNFAIKQFTGKIDGSNTYRDLAEQFRTYSRWTPSYGTFKKEFYEYLTASIDPRYSSGQFGQQLYQQLQQTLPQSDNQKLDDMLLVGTCRKLLDFLVVQSPQQPTHYIFGDLTGNLGITPTVGLLLKIVLLCKQVNFYLEQRFAILFNHYEASNKNQVKWLVESLENLNVAFSTNFGSVHLC
ncbi:MAG: hypothetical protein F6K47_15265 [Symploca sp. SIO2E6]|nr:hypothetical protein [Symploca sp. SIO2E6]